MNPASQDGPLLWHQEPDTLDHNAPALCIAAFDGWNDAGEAATRTVRRLASLWKAELLAEIDPEEFVDFSNTRPMVERKEGNRIIKWPATEVFRGVTPTGQPVIFVVGPEPQLKWRTFCSVLGRVFEATNVEMTILLGALLTDVPHTRPTRINMTASTQEMAGRFDVTVSRYEGPTGIVGVLADACQQFGIPTISMWASVPHYLPGTTAPRSALALIEAVGNFLEFPLSPLELHVESAAFDRQINEVVDADDDMRRYVSQLEERFDDGDDDEEDDDDLDEDDIDMTEDDSLLSADDVLVNGSLTDATGRPISGDALAAELEQFLRDRDS
jgi:PAC2 family